MTMANWNKIVQRFLPGVKFKIVTDFGTSPPLPEGAVVIYVGGSYLAVNLWVKKVHHNNGRIKRLSPLGDRTLDKHRAYQQALKRHPNYLQQLGRDRWDSWLIS